MECVRYEDADCFCRHMGYLEAATYREYDLAPATDER